ncbi:50S ribosomal protein L21e [Candidatus Woesearchaeota archaeon]|nr:50S ribosomal protein L21e [Candidatus Woesearchaeota archaeon]MBW3017081.1 50S ribosomal protein L21e [Candidatus Woesearchaeota archaeon]
MAMRRGGSRRKTRTLLSKKKFEKGKVSLKDYFQVFKAGDKVKLVAEPSVHEGMFFTRYYGKVGVVKGKRGKCYAVDIKDGKVTKTIITHPIHLSRP